MSIAARRIAKTDVIPSPSLYFDFSKETLEPIIGKNVFTFTRTTPGTYINKSGVRVTAPINTPRFEYDSQGNPLGLLIEEGRTNFFLNSGAPVTQTVTTTAGTRYCLWCEGPAGSQVTLTLGTAVGTITGGSPVGTAIPGNYVVVSITTQGTFNLTVGGAPTLVQFENGAEPSSYIATTGSTVARGADNFLSTSIQGCGWFNQDESTIIVEGDSALRSISAGQAYFLEFSDGTIANLLTLGRGTQYFDMRIKSANTHYGFGANGLWTTGTKKLGMSVRQGPCHFQWPEIHKFALQSRDVPLMPQNITCLNIGSSIVFGNYLCGHVKTLTYYPKSISGSALRALVNT